MNLVNDNSNMEIDYGYGDAVPDVALRANDDPVDYGYGNGAPDSAVENGKIDYGYGVAVPEVAKQDIQRRPPRARHGRRSSMKQQGATRRSSIGISGEISVQLPGKTNPVRRRRSICFEEGKNEVKHVEPTRTLTNEELWFRDEEYSMMHEKVRLLTNLAQIEDEKVLVENNLCTRGLESRIDCDAVYEQQYLAWKSVFVEQYYQRSSGKYDENTVSQLYKMASSQSQAEAHRRAQKDTEETEKYMRTTRRMMRRLSC